MLRVGDHRAAQAAVLAFKSANRGLRTRINKATRETMNPVWRGLVAEHARTATDRAVVVKGARIAAGNPPVAVAATSRRPLRGGLVPIEQWPAVELGAARNVRTTYRRRSKNGGTHTVTRRTRRQLPDRTSSGRVALRAAADIGPRLASLWVQIIVRVYRDAAEGQ